MNLFKLVLRSLWFYRRTNLGALLGALIGSMVLVGALVVGDCVQLSLRSMALARLGSAELVLSTPDRYFRSQLASEMSGDLKTTIAPVLSLRGSAVMPDGSARIALVHVYGVDERFWSLGDSASSPEGFLLNDRLAQGLGASVGSAVVLRIEKPGALPREAPLSTNEDFLTPLRIEVEAIAPETRMGRFSLQANQIEPYNVFVPLQWLQEKTDLTGRANMLLAGGGTTTEAAEAALRRHFSVADTALELLLLQNQEAVELRTERIFIDAPLADAVHKELPGGRDVFTYFVNELRHNENATPYSMVSAISAPPVALEKNEILLNRWLADDLQAATGSVIAMKYYVLGPMRKLVEREAQFTVRGVLPIEGIAADKELMPAFPGLSDSDNCRDWEPGFPINLERIRDKDEEYWDKYGGTPKAFINLDTAQKLWGNRYGNLTAIRYQLNEKSVQSLEGRIAKAIEPASVGLFFQPVRQQALAASSEGLDFGQLFLGLSFFLIISALLLLTLLFVFGVQQRAGQIGVLLAIGYQPALVRRLLLAEGLVLATMGAIAGTACGVLYTRVVLLGLSSVWVGAVGGTSTIAFHCKTSTLLVGMLVSILLAAVSIWLAVRKQASLPARLLLSGETESGQSLISPTSRRTRAVPWTGIGATLCALGLIAITLMQEGSNPASAFFGAGALLLIAGISFTRALLVFMTRSGGQGLAALYALGVRNATRRRGRSLASVALLACGCFMIIAVGASGKNPLKNIEQRYSGTGGFALLGQSSLPVYNDLNTEEGLATYGLSPSDLPGVRVVHMRVRAGDDASCLNLNRAQVPRLLGVDPKELQSRGAFRFIKAIDKKAASWNLLDYKFDDGALAAVGDESTIVWGLGKGVGDTITYSDDTGRSFPVRIVAIIGNSVLQGNLIISEKGFIDRFPSLSGYREFLIDAPFAQMKKTSAKLSNAMADSGMELTSCGSRLEEFSRVENTYLSIFQALGGLGLILGSLGLGIVVLRNTMERRGELALLRAVGLPVRSLYWLVLSEHWFLLAAGLVTGTLAALLAVLPSLLSSGSGTPYASLALTLVAIAASGVLWTWLATAAALRGPLLSALRNE
jgi:putative ABC transport system permease protein